jgi:hypothetical protein
MKRILCSLTFQEPIGFPILSQILREVDKCDSTPGARSQPCGGYHTHHSAATGPIGRSSVPIQRSPVQMM